MDVDHCIAARRAYNGCKDRNVRTRRSDADGPTGQCDTRSIGGGIDGGVYCAAIVCPQVQRDGKVPTVIWGNEENRHQHYFHLL
jgi:hypothetical protein